MLCVHYLFSLLYYHELYLFSLLYYHELPSLMVAVKDQLSLHPDSPSLEADHAGCKDVLRDGLLSESGLHL